VNQMRLVPYKVHHLFVEIDVIGPDLFHGREGVYVNRSGDPLDLAKRILRSGVN
jgi:hypothetical protein